MSLVPYNFFQDMEKFFSDWPELNKESVGRVPRSDVYETEDNMVAEFEIPGVDASDIDVEVKKDMVKVEAESEKKQKQEEKGYRKKEISHGYFRRIVPLGKKVKEDEAEASYNKGVLTVTIPKQEVEEAEEGKKVEVKEE